MWSFWRSRRRHGYRGDAALPEPVAVTLVRPLRPPAAARSRRDLAVVLASATVVASVAISGMCPVPATGLADRLPGRHSHVVAGLAVFVLEGTGGLARSRAAR